MLKWLAAVAAAGFQAGRGCDSGSAMDVVEASPSEILATSKGCDFVDMLMRRLSDLEAETQSLRQDNQQLHEEIEALSIPAPKHFAQPRQSLIFQAKIARPEDASIEDLGATLKEEYGSQGVIVDTCVL